MPSGGAAGVASAGLARGLRLRPRRSVLASCRAAQAYKVGSTSSVSKVAETSPPITTTASGRWVSAPMACDSAIGSSPSIASNAVIRTVRSRVKLPCSTASISGMPDSRSWL